MIPRGIFLPTRFRSIFALVSLSWLLTATALADERTDARRHFRAGMASIERGEIDAGVAELKLAYEILPHPNVLYNIARAYAESSRYAESIDYFQRYLRSDPEDRDEVTRALAELQDRFAAETVASELVPEASNPDALPPINVSEEQLAALDESAQQMMTLADATQSSALRERAERLRAVAEALRAAPSVQPATAPEPPVTTAPTEVAPTAESVVVGPERSGDTYQEEVVSASRFAQSPLDAPNSTTIVTAQDIRLSGLTSVPALLRRAAGVEVMELTPGDTEVSIRGLNQRLSNKVLVLLDGRSVYLDFLGANLWESIPVTVEEIERIEIIRGPASALYGADAFSGIVNIITKTPEAGSSSVSGRFGMGNSARAAGTLAGRIGNVGYRFSSGYTTSDSYALEVTPERRDLAPFRDDPYNGVERFYFGGDLAYDFGDGYRGQAGFGGTLGSLNFMGLGRLRQMVSSDFYFGQTHAALTTPFGLTARTYWNRFVSDASTVERIPGGVPVYADEITQDVADVELAWSKEFDFLVKHNVVIGAGYRFKSIDWSWLSDLQREHHASAYVQDTLSIGESLKVVLSARIDRHPLLKQIQFSPRGSIVYRLTEGSSLRATVGTAFRSPTFLESYLQFDNPTPVRSVVALGQGNDELSPERMLSAELGYTFADSDYIALELNGYFNVVDDQIVLTRIDRYTLSDQYAGEGAYNESEAAYRVGALRFENEDARFFQAGGEFGVRVYPVAGLDIYANYSFHDTFAENDTALGERKKDKRTSPHKVNAGVQYRSRFGLDVGVDFNYLTAQTWVEQVTDPVEGVRFQAFELPAYALLNARLGYRLLNDSVELSVSGTNLTGQRHREHPYAQPVDTRIFGSAMLRF